MRDAELGMRDLEGEWRSVDPPRCVVCEDVIGVYEPLVHIGGGAATRTSRAARPEICSNGRCYHLDCYAQVADES
jgi:hypothetical protein